MESVLAQFFLSHSNCFESRDLKYSSSPISQESASGGFVASRFCLGVSSVRLYCVSLLFFFFLFNWDYLYAISYNNCSPNWKKKKLTVTGFELLALFAQVGHEKSKINSSWKRKNTVIYFILCAMWWKTAFKIILLCAANNICSVN